MKIAVLVYGMYREFDYAVKSWDYLFDLDCDFYFSLWNISKKTHVPTYCDIVKPVTSDMILKHIPNAKISLLNEDDLDVSIPVSNKMVHHWVNGLNMIKNSEIKYDIIMLVRPDSYFFIKIPTDNVNYFNKKNVIYGTQGTFISSELHYVTEDRFLMGDFETISEFITTIDARKNIYKSIHHYISDSLFENRFSFVQIGGIVVSVLRPNFILLDQNNVTHNQLEEKIHEWENPKIPINYLDNHPLNYKIVNK